MWVHGSHTILKHHLFAACYLPHGLPVVYTLTFNVPVSDIHNNISFLSMQGLKLVEYSWEALETF